MIKSILLIPALFFGLFNDKIDNSDSTVLNVLKERYHEEFVIHDMEKEPRHYGLNFNDQEYFKKLIGPPDYFSRYYRISPKTNQDIIFTVFYNLNNEGNVGDFYYRGIIEYSAGKKIRPLLKTILGNGDKFECRVNTPTDSDFRYYEEKKSPLEEILERESRKKYTSFGILFEITFQDYAGRKENLIPKIYELYQFLNKNFKPLYNLNIMYYNNDYHYSIGLNRFYPKIKAVNPKYFSGFINDPYNWSEFQYR